MMMVVMMMVIMVNGHDNLRNHLSADNYNDNRHLLSKSTMALLCRDIPLCSLPFKVTFLLLRVDPLAELISAVHHAKQADTVSRLDSHTTRVDPGHQKTIAACHQQGQQQSCQAQHLGWQRSLVEVNQAIKAW